MAEEVRCAFDEPGMVFLYAPAFHPAMRFVAPVRRALGVPTIMNLTGPLANPAGVRHQVVGVAEPGHGPLVANALLQLDALHALVVHAEAGMDEIAPSGRSRMWEVQNGEVHEWVVEPGSYRLGGEDLSALAGGDPAANAARIRTLFADPALDPSGRAAVILNGAAAVYVAGLVASFREGVEAATEALEDGRATAALDRLLADAVSTSE